MCALNVKHRRIQERIDTEDEWVSVDRNGFTGSRKRIDLHIEKEITEVRPVRLTWWKQKATGAGIIVKKDVDIDADEDDPLGVD